MPLSALARVDAGEAAFAWLSVSQRLFTAACAATIGGDLMREGGGSGLRQSGRIVASRRPPVASPLTSAASRPHAECVTRRRRVGAGESRPCISPAPRSGNPAGEMTDAPTPTRRKSSIIVGRNATSNEKHGDKPTYRNLRHAGRCGRMEQVK